MWLFSRRLRSSRRRPSVRVSSGLQYGEQPGGLLGE
jgi:hypothetical protein